MFLCSPDAARVCMDAAYVTAIAVSPPSPPNLEVTLAAAATHHHIDHSYVCFLVLFLWRVHLIG